MKKPIRSNFPSDAHKRSHEVRLMESLAKAIVSEQPVESVMQKLADELVSTFKFKVAAVTQFSRARGGFVLVGMAPHQTLRRLSSSLLRSNLQNLVFPFNPEKQKVIRTLAKGMVWRGKSLADIVTPTIPAVAARIAQKLMGLRSFANYPLMRGRVLVGSFLIGQETETFSDEQLRFIGRISHHAALAVYQAELLGESRKSAERYRLLEEVDRKILEEKNLPKVLQAIVQNIHVVVPSDLAGVFLFDEKRAALVHSVSSRDTKFARALDSLAVPLGKGIVGQVAKTRNAEIINNAHNDRREWYGRGHVRSQGHMICVPLVAGRRLLGLLHIDRFSDEPFQASDLEVSKVFAEKSSLAIESATLFGQQIEREKELESLQRSGTKILRSLDLNEVLRSILDEALRALPAADRGSIMLSDEGNKELYVAAMRGYDKDVKENFRLGWGRGLGGRVVRTKKGIRVDDVRATSFFVDLPVKNRGPEIRSVIAVPLMQKNKAIGVINLDCTTRPSAFTQKDLSRLELFAVHAALAVNNATLHASVRQEVKRILLLQRIKDTARQGDSTKTFLGRVCQFIVEEYQFHLVCVMMYEPDRRMFRLAAGKGSEASHLNANYEQSIDEGIIGWVGRTKKYRMSQVVTKDRLHINPGRLSTKAELCVPILDGRGDCIGVVNTESNRLYAFSVSDLRMMQAVASEIAGAVAEQKLLSALRQSEKQYRSLVEYANDAVVLIGVDGTFRFVNKMFVTITGYLPNEVLGKHYDVIIDPEERAAVREWMEASMKRKAKTSRSRLTIVCRDGKRRVVDYNGRILREGRAVIGILGIARDVTNEMELQKRLEESEKKFRTLFEKSKDAIYVSTPDGKLLDINEAGVELFGFENKEALLKVHIGRDLYANPADRHIVLREVEEKGFLKDVELRLKKKNGEPILVHESTTALRDAKGNVIAYQGILRDVTRERESERVLHESEEKYRSLVEDSLVGVYVIQEGRFIFVNKRFAEIFGYDVEEIVRRMNVSDLVVAEDRSQVAENIRRRVEGEVKSIRYSFRGLRKDGEQLELEVYGTGSLYLGRPAVIGTILDRTQERRSEREIADWQRRYDLIIASSGQMVYEYDIRRGTILWSGSIEKVLGYKLEEMRGNIEEWAELIHPDDVARATSLLDGCRARLTPYDTEYRFKKKDGTYICMHDRGFFLGDESGTATTMLGMMEDVTNQKELERRVRSSELKHRLLFEHNNDAVFVMRDETLVDCNSKALEMFGCQRQEMIGQTLYDFSPPRQPDGQESRVAALQRIRAALDGLPQQFFWRHVKRDGTIFSAEVRLNRFDLEGEMLVQAQVRDITAELEVQEDLARSEEKYRQLVQEAGEAILVTDGEGNLVEVNDKACDLLGFTRVELLRMNIADLADPPREEAFAAYRRFYKRLIQEGNIVAADQWMKRKDGAHFPYQINAVLLGNGMLQALIRDLSEEKRTEQELDQIYAIAATLHGQELFDRAATAIAQLLGMKYVVIGELYESNKVVRALTMYQKGKIVRGFEYTLAHSPCERVRSKQDMCLYSERVRELFSEDRVLVDWEIESYIGLPMVDGKHVPIGIVSAFDERRHVFSDHERKILSIITQRLSSELEMLSQMKREEQLSHQLLQSQKMESLGTLAGGIAHDFNNILGAVLGYTSLIKKQIDPSSNLGRYLDAIEKSSQRAASLSKQLLSFAHKTQSDIRPISVNQIISDTIHIIQSSFPKEISVKTELSPTLPMVMGDQTQLGQVMMNICINARDAIIENASRTEAGLLTITTSHFQADAAFLDSHLSAEPGKYVCVNIVDNGIGMNREIQQRIFEPFFTTKGKGRGTGLGLSMVYGIVRNHNGFIDVSSEVGHGTTVKVYIPAVDRPIPATADIPREQELLPPGQGEVILFVDDEPMLRELVADILSTHGYEVIVAANGKEAVDLYQRHHERVRLVLLDMIMPEMDGVATFFALRAINQEVRIVISSGFSHDAAVQRLMNNGAVGFVGKPYQADDLLKLIGTALKS